MKSRSTFLLLAGASLTALSACSYNLECLRGPGRCGDAVVSDAGSDIATSDDTLDVAVVDVPTNDDALDSTLVDTSLQDAQDTGIVDVPSDTRDAGDAGTPDAMPSCVPFSDTSMSGPRYGGSLVITGDTTNGTSLSTPPTIAGTGNCNASYATEAPSNDRMFRYTMQSAGWLYATTDAPPCEGVFDSVVWMQNNCFPPQTSPVSNIHACNDDSATLRVCPAENGFDPQYSSSLLSPSFTAGQNVWVGLDGYAGARGRYRLVLVERGVRNEPPPVTDIPTGFTAGNRCACGPASDNAVVTTSFPTTTDSENYPSPNYRVFASRAFPTLATVQGIAFEGYALLNSFPTATCPADARAVFDIAIDNKIIHSFSINQAVGTGVFRVAYQTFAPLTLTASTAVSIRLRSVIPSTCVPDIAFSKSAFPGTLTLVGRAR